MELKAHIEALHNLAADTSRPKEQRKEILLKIDRLKEIESKIWTAELMEHMALADEANEIIGKSYPPPSTDYECEGCGS